MKQLTVYCSLDIEDAVVTIFDRIGVDGFMRIGNATGSRLLPEGQVPRTMTWEVSVFVIPVASDEIVDSVTNCLEEYAGKCDVEPCLRYVVTPVEEAY
jgi:hypothetical protein